VINEDTENKKELSPQTRRLIESYQDSLSKKELPEDTQTIQVDEIASRVAGFYEKVRMIVDWKAEHLIRRAAIERSLKRRFLGELGLGILGTTEMSEISESLILELIRGGHFPNDQIPRTKISEVESVLKKYFYILETHSEGNDISPSATKRKVNFYNWLLEVAACEIEEQLDPPLKEFALINYMTDQLTVKLRIEPGLKVSEEVKEIQTYLSYLLVPSWI